MSEYQTKLQAWYIARLRKLASERLRESSQTPSELLNADRETILKLREDISKLANSQTIKRLNTSQLEITKKDIIIFCIFSSQFIFLLFILFLTLSPLKVLETKDLIVLTSCLLIFCSILVHLIFYFKVTRKQIYKTKKIRNFINYSLAEAEIKELARLNDTKEIISYIQNLRIENQELKEKERLIVDFAPVVCFMLDKELKILAINHSSLEYWHLLDKELVNKTIFDVLQPLNIDYIQNSFFEAQNSKQLIQKEISICPRDKQVLDTRWHIEWSNSEEAYFCTSINIEQEKQLEKIKKEFISVVSHDIRGPLMNIGYALDLMLKGEYGNVSESIQNKLESVFKHVKNIINLANELLDLERSDSGLLVFDKSPCDLFKILDKAVELCVETANQKNISIKIESHLAEAQELKPNIKIIANEIRLQQVFMNFLNNAIKFSPKDSEIKINIKTKGNELLVEICDDGPGITEENQKIIFDRYKQDFKNLSAQNTGSGLGLAICKAYILALGGNIGVSSDGIKGSTFWITLKRDNLI